MERLWQRAKLTVHREMYVAMRAKVKSLIDDAKVSHYQTTVSECRGDCRKLFSVFRSPMGKLQDQALPSGADPTKLAEDFSSFFREKVSRIRSEIGELHQPVITDGPLDMRL